MSNGKVLPPVELGKCVEGCSAWEKDTQAFWKMRESLLPKYCNKYVAVYQEQVIDSDEDELALAKRVYERYGYVPVYVQLVAPDPLPVKRVPSPRPA